MTARSCLGEWLEVTEMENRRDGIDLKKEKILSSDWDVCMGQLSGVHLSAGMKEAKRLLTLSPHIRKLRCLTGSWELCVEFKKEVLSGYMD